MLVFYEFFSARKALTTLRSLNAWVDLIKVFLYPSYQGNDEQILRNSIQATPRKTVNISDSSDTSSEKES